MASIQFPYIVSHSLIRLISQVEKSESRGPKKPSQKLFVGNIKEGTTSEELRELFSKHCEVLEADVIRNYG